MSQTNPEEQMHRFPITDDMTPSRATYLAVAQVRDCDPLDLPPLGEAIDPDALDALLNSPTDSEVPSSTFEYAGCSVTVTAKEVCVID